MTISKGKGIRFNMALSYVDMLVSMAVGFFYVPVLLFFIGKSDYGLMQLILSVTAYTAVAQLGMSSAITRYTARFLAEGNPEKITQLITMTFLIYCVTAFLAIAAGLVICFNMEVIFKLTAEEAVRGRIAFLLAMANAIIGIPGNIPQSLMQGYNRYSVLYACNIGKYVIRVIVLTVLLFQGYGLYSVFLVDLVLDVSIRIVFMIFLHGRLQVRFRLVSFDKAFFREITRFSTFIFIGFLADMVFWRTGSILIGMLRNTAEVAVYSITQNLTAYLIRIATTFSSVFLPVLTGMVVRKEPQAVINGFFQKASRYQFMLIYGVLLNFIFLGREFIDLWVGPAFSQAFFYTLIVFAPLSIVLFETTGVSLLFSMNRHKTRAIVFACNAVLNIILGFVFINRFGTVGAAISTATTTLLGHVVFMNLYYRKVLGMNMLRFFSRVTVRTLVFSIPVILLFIGGNFVFPEYHLITFAGKVLICNAVYAVLLLFFVFEQKEKAFVLRKIHFLKRSIPASEGKVL